MVKVNLLNKYQFDEVKHLNYALEVLCLKHSTVRIRDADSKADKNLEANGKDEVDTPDNH